MPTNDFLIWDAAGTNIESQAAYAADSARTGGVGSGIASFTLYNKVTRQASAISAMIAAYIVQQTGQDALDDGTITTLLANFTAATKGSLLNVQTFSTVGTATYTPTTGTAYVIVEVQAGGGAGAGCPIAAGGAAGVPGAAGAYGMGKYTSAFAGLTVTVGAAGVAAAGTTGGNGGASSFGGLLTCPGGAGGTTSTNVAVQITGGQGSPASPTGANLISGQSDCGQMSLTTPGNPSCAYGGGGGRTKFGGGGVGTTVNANGAAPSATSYGAGGAGTAAVGTSGTLTGGNGAQGVVYVWEFS
jgi:hypothetical protein